MIPARVRQARLSDRDDLAERNALLWPEASLEEHLKALDDALNNKTSGTLPSAILVSRDEHGVLLGFLKLASALTPTAATPHTARRLRGKLVR